MKGKKFVDRAEEFYMDKFNTMFEHDEKESKKRKKLQEKLGVNTPEEVIFESVLIDIANESEKNSDIFYKTASKKPINEADEFGMDDEEEDEEEEETYDDPDDEPIDDSEEIPEDEMDEMDKADEILEEIDLEEIDNPTRVELIRNIIDAAQNQTEEEDEMTFDDFIAELQTVIEEFQYDETDELDETEDDIEDDYSDEGEEEVDAEEDVDMEEEPMDEEPEEEEEI